MILTPTPSYKLNCTVQERRESGRELDRKVQGSPGVEGGQVKVTVRNDRSTLCIYVEVPKTNL